MLPTCPVKDAETHNRTGRLPGIEYPDSRTKPVMSGFQHKMNPTRCEDQTSGCDSASVTTSSALHFPLSSRRHSLDLIWGGNDSQIPSTRGTIIVQNSLKYSDRASNGSQQRLPIFPRRNWNSESGRQARESRRFRGILPTSRFRKLTPERSPRHPAPHWRSCLESPRHHRRSPRVPGAGVAAPVPGFGIRNQRARHDIEAWNSDIGPRS